MSSLQFKKAERTKAKLKLAITGPSGSGKTMSALRLAKGIGGKIALIDTENESASLYSDRFGFDTLALAPPYTTAKYLEAIQAAIESKYDVIIIDSISHQWAGEGGILNRKEQMDSRGGNSFTNWGKLTPEQEKFKSTILHCPIHLIATIRSKQDYIMSENDKGKQAPKKVGLAPVQREGMEYEFTTVFDVAMNHEAAVSKDRTGIFDDGFFKITEDVGKSLKVWLDKGIEVKKPTVVVGNSEVNVEFDKPPEAARPITPASPISPAKPNPAPAPKTFVSERSKLGAVVNEERRRLDWTADQLGQFMNDRFGKPAGELTVDELSQLIAELKDLGGSNERTNEV